MLTVSRCIAFVVTVVAILHSVATAPRGLDALSYDGFRYLAGAYSIRDHGRYLDLDGTPQIVWPPGTSLLYAAVSRLTSTAPETLVLPIGLTAVLVTLFAFWMLLERTAAPGWAASLGFAVLAWNGVFLSQASKLASDVLALALVVVVLWTVSEGLRRNAIPWLVAATAATAAGILVRFAMAAAVVLLIAAAFVVCRRTGRTLWLLTIPCLAPLPAVVSFAVLGIGHANRFAAARAPVWSQYGSAFAELANQVLPVTPMPGLITAAVVALTIAVPLTAALAPSRTPARTAIFVAAAWIAIYTTFLLVAQALATPSFRADLRILFPLYPAMIAASVASTAYLRRPLVIVAALVLGIGAVRSTRYMIGSMRSSEQRRACVSREELVREISALKVAPQGVLASNAQGLTWYALRRPVRLRTASRDGIAGDVLIWIDPARACEFAIDAEGVARPPCSASTLGANVVVCRDGATR